MKITSFISLPPPKEVMFSLILGLFVSKDILKQCEGNLVEVQAGAWTREESVIIFLRQIQAINCGFGLFFSLSLKSGCCLTLSLPSQLQS